MVTVPLRLDEEVLATIVKATLPLPVPLAPVVTEIQLALLVAVQVQELEEGVTETFVLVPVAPIDTLRGDTV